MVKKLKLFGNVEITKDLKLLLTVGGLYSLSVALSNTFVNIFLWKQSGRYVEIGLYNLAIIVSQLIVFTIAGLVAKKVDRVVVLRIGVIFLTIFYLSVLITGPNATKYNLLLGSLLGAGYGFFWLAFNVLTFEITEPETRDFFNGFLGVLTSISGMIGPISAGYIISQFENSTGYFTIFGTSLALFSLAVIVSFFLNRRPSIGTYMLKDVWLERKSNFNWRRITNAHFFQGLREGIFAFVVAIFVFISTGSELALGKFGLLNSIVSFISYYVVSRYLAKKYRKKAIFIGGLILYGAILLLLFKITYVKLLLYAVIIAIAYPLLLVPYLSMTFDVIGKSSQAAELRIEYIVLRDIFLNLGKVVSITTFIGAVTFFDAKNSIPVILTIFGASHIIIYFCIRGIKSVNLI